MIDVAIIGGGPAGAGAAIACARAGLAAMLLERRGGDLVAPVGAAEESLMPDAIGLLQDMGVDAAAIGTPFAGVAVQSAMVLFGGHVPAAGLHVRRPPLDQALRDAARRTGAVVATGVRVVGVERRPAGFLLRTDSQEIAAARLIDASGRSRWLAHRFQLPRPTASPPLIAWRDIVVDPIYRTGAVARFEPSPDGWTWLAEVEAGRVVRTLLTSARPRSSRRRPSSTATAHAATWHVGYRVAGPGWLIAGDAAAALDPASGNGIVAALRSGLAAGHATVRCLAEPRVASAAEAYYHQGIVAAFAARAAELRHRYRQAGIGVLDTDGSTAVPSPAGRVQVSAFATSRSVEKRRDVRIKDRTT